MKNTVSKESILAWYTTRHLVLKKDLQFLDFTFHRKSALLWTQTLIDLFCYSVHSEFISKH